MVNDEITRNKLTKGLSQGQADALMLLLNFIKIPSDDMFVLKGYAGTGKTFLVKKFIAQVNGIDPKAKIAVTAPTNKAVNVLKSKNALQGKNIIYSTIHSLLGLTENISNDGKVSFTSNGAGILNKVKYLIIDETSMLQDEIFETIAPHSDRVKIIFMGDAAQIPPVGKVDCIPFRKSLSKSCEEGYTLTEIMRQEKGNPIIENSFILRNNLTKPIPIPVLKTEKDDNGHGLIWLDPVTQREEMLHLLETHFTSSKFDADSDYAKVIAWRNKTVATVNNFIRTKRYGEKPAKIMPGERILANKPVFNNEGQVVFATSEEFVILSSEVKNAVVAFGGQRLNVTIYECGVSASYSSNTNTKLKILHEGSEASYEKFLSELKQKALSNKGMGKYWVEYYNAVKWPADIVYNYAITAHKSQGSSYENVFLMEDDIDFNKNVVERNRIKYTAYSRASKNLYVYRKNPF